jgi:hypothetical protein
MGSNLVNVSSFFLKRRNTIAIKGKMPSNTLSM